MSAVRTMLLFVFALFTVTCSFLPSALSGELKPEAHGAQPAHRTILTEGLVKIVTELTGRVDDLERRVKAQEAQLTLQKAELTLQKATLEKAGAAVWLYFDPREGAYPKAASGGNPTVQHKVASVQRLTPGQPGQWIVTFDGHFDGGYAVLLSSTTVHCYATSNGPANVTVYVRNEAGQFADAEFFLVCFGTFKPR